MPVYLFVSVVPADERQLERFTLNYPGTPQDAEVYVRDQRIGAPMEYRISRMRKEELQQPVLLCMQWKLPADTGPTAAPDDVDIAAGEPEDDLIGGDF